MVITDPGELKSESTQEVSVHPGDIIQGATEDYRHSHLFLVTETHNWGVGAIIRYPIDGGEKETYHRFKPGEFVVCGYALLLPPEIAQRRNDSIRTAHELAKDSDQ